MNKKLILISTILASGMTFLMGGLVGVSLPTIQSYFGASISQVQWILNSYALTLASFILLGGALGDYYGKRKFFLLGTVIFLLGSVLSFISQSIEYLIAFQALMGVGAALMVPGSLAILNDTFSSKERGKAIGMWAGISGGVAALGPVLGGFLVESFGWRYIFLTLSLVGVLSLIISYFSIPSGLKKIKQSIDWIGVTLVLLFLLSLSFGLIQGPSMGWGSFMIISSFTISIASAISFVIVEKYSKNPLVPMKIFENRNVTICNISTFLIYLPLNTVIIFVVLLMQQSLGYSPSASGLGLLPPILIITLFAGLGGTIVDKYGPRIPLFVGSLLVSISMFLLAGIQAESNYWIHLFPGLSLLGIGMAIIIAPITKGTLSVRKEYSGTASGINNAVSRVATLIAISMMGAIMASLFSIFLMNDLSTVNLSPEELNGVISQKDRLGDIDIHESFSQEKENVVNMVIKSSFIKSFSIIMIISGVLAAISSILSILFIRNKN